MFENILGHREIVDELSTQIRGGELPSSLLFFGPKYSGKSTTALEVARGLTCLRGDADWRCSCRACEQQRLLAHPQTRLLGSRSFLEEILGAADVVKRNDKAATRYLMIRAVRKLIRRFDPELWDEKDRKLGTVSSTITEVNELIEEIAPDVEPKEGAGLEKTVDQIVELCRKIDKAITGETIPVDQIRRVAAWAHTTAARTRKIVLLENADRMGDSSENALLKLLEEPPNDTYLIVMTGNKGAIAATIKSRLRPYRFVPRPRDVEQEVLKRVFREESDKYKTLEEYFLAWRISPEIIRNQCRRFLHSVLEYDEASLVEIVNDSNMQSILDDRSIFLAFLKEILNQLGSSIHVEVNGHEHSPGEARSGGSDASKLNKRIDLVWKLDRWNEQVRRAYRDLVELNMSSSLLLEKLFVSLRNTL